MLVDARCRTKPLRPIWSEMRSKVCGHYFLKPFLLLKYSLPNCDIAQTQEARSSIPTPPQYLKRCVTQLVVSFLCSLNIAAFSCFFVPYCLPTFLLSASSVSSQEHCRLGGTHCGYLWPPKIGTAVL